MKRDIVAMKKEEHVTYFLSMNLVRYPINGDEIAYVKHTNAKKYPKLIINN